MNDIRIQAPPEKVLAAFFEPEPLKAWWGVERSLIQLRPGGLFNLVWNITEKGMGYVSSGIVRSYRAGSLLDLENMAYFNPSLPILGPMQMRIEVTGSESASELTVTQDGYRSGPDWDWYYEAVVEAWPHALQNLKTYLESN